MTTPENFLSQYEKVSGYSWGYGCNTHLHDLFIRYAEIYHQERVKSSLGDVSGMFSEEQMEKAYNDGREAEEQRCGYFDIENYR